MPECPKCKADIDELSNYESGEQLSVLCLIEFEGKEIPNYEDRDFQQDGKTNDFECPKCSEVLFTDEDKAIAFLEDKDELQEIVSEKLNKIKEKTKKFPPEKNKNAKVS